jgi:hypothetical protein
MLILVFHTCVYVYTSATCPFLSVPYVVCVYYVNFMINCHL